MALNISNIARRNAFVSRKWVTPLAIFLAVLMVFPSVGATSATVNRDLPAQINPGVGFDVQLILDINETASPSSAVVVEYIPSGWNVTACQPTCIFDYSQGKIKWMLFETNLSDLTTDVSDKTINYSAYSPIDASGNYQFDGQVMTINENTTATGDLIVTVSSGGTTGTITGNVVDLTGTPIEDAQVDLQGTGLTANTSSDGSYIINNVPAGLYNVTSRKTGYFLRTSLSVTVISDTVTSVNFNLPEAPSVTPTPFFMNFYGEASLNGVPVVAGDIITAYDPAGNACGKITVTTDGNYGIMHCYGDDPGTPEDEGAEDGDSITFRVNGYAANYAGINIWSDLAQENVNLTASKTITVSLNLDAGWNLISIPVELQDTSVSSVLSSIDGAYSRVMAYDDGYLTFDPTLPVDFNSLSNITYQMGIWVKMDSPGILSVSGPEPVDKSIPIKDGWNLVSYLKNSSLDIPLALVTINGTYTRLMTYDKGYKAYDTEVDPIFNTLNLMSPHQGYLLKANSVGVLTY